jgi:D-alanyl-D-alanine carboxypeptidase
LRRCCFPSWPGRWPRAWPGPNCRSPLARLLADAGLPEDALGLVVAPLGRGARFVEHGAERVFQPGSTMKLVTTLVGLEQLGPTFVGRTRLLAAKPARDGVLQGDLVLQGGADADFSAGRTCRRCCAACATAA